MKTSFVAVLASLGLANAIPVDQVPPVHQLDARQLVVSDELKNGQCAGSVFIFARGSTETDNMVSRIGESKPPHTNLPREPFAAPRRARL